MEITILALVWVTTLFFLYMSFVNKNNMVFMLFSAIGFFMLSYAVATITYIAPNSVGATYVTLTMGNSHTEGILGLHWFLFLCGIVLVLIIAAYMITGKKVGDEV